MSYGIVYVWMCIKTQMSYVGQTVQTLSKRWSAHCKGAQIPKCSHWEFYKAIREHGPENFQGKILYECDTAEELAQIERKFISELNTMWPNGYNMRNGSNKCSDVTRQKMREAKLGRSLSNEHKENIRQANLNRDYKSLGPMSEEHRHKIGEANRNRPKPKRTHNHAMKIVKPRMDRTTAKHESILKMIQSGASLDDICQNFALTRHYVLYNVIHRAVKLGNLSELPQIAKF